MQLPSTKARELYSKEIKRIEAFLKDAMDSPSTDTPLSDIQEDLDLLAERYQDDAAIGSTRYKLYELQAIIYYFEGKDQEALDFIQVAIETRGSSYVRAENLIRKIESKPVPSKKAEITFFHGSPVAVGLLSFFTLNFYSLYWSYKHWRTIRLSTGKRTYPILSAIFQIFTTYSLFKKIRDNAQKSGYKKFNKAGWAAVGYIVLFIGLNAATREPANTLPGAGVAIVCALLATAAISLILATVQRAANAHNVATLGKKRSFKKVFVGEIIMAILGAIFALLTIIGMFSVAVDNQGSDMVRQAETRMSLLEAEYNLCNTSLENRRSSIDLTNEFAIDRFNRDVEDCNQTRLKYNESIDVYNRSIGH